METHSSKKGASKMEWLLVLGAIGVTCFTGYRLVQRAYLILQRYVDIEWLAYMGEATLPVEEKRGMDADQIFKL
jgi:hypothetical protein